MLFPIKKLQPTGAFLSLSNAPDVMTLSIPFRLFEWQGECLETQISADLFNQALPSPYIRDLANQRFHFSETENGIYPEHSHIDMDKIQKIEASFYLSGKHFPVVISELQFLPNKQQTALTLLIKGYFDFEFEGLDNYQNTPFILNAPLWSSAI